MHHMATPRPRPPNHLACYRGIIPVCLWPSPCADPLLNVDSVAPTLQPCAEHTCLEDQVTEAVGAMVCIYVFAILEEAQ
jgi:hypothetical protein